MLDRRRFALAAATSLAALGLPPAMARAPLSGRQVPGVWRRKVGSIEVTALSDGTVPLPLDVFAGLERAELERILGLQGLRALPPTAVNAYLINTGERTYLVDAGAGANQAFGPTLGRLRENLAAAGVEPGQIDAVVLTHAHADHAEGLVTAAGEALFPNAEVVIHEREAAFWLDEGNTARAPEAVRPFFLSAQKALRPYAARMRRSTGGEVGPGLTLEPAFGHTPGHSILRVASGGQQMLFVGDILHNTAIHTARPDATFAFDADGAEAARSRARVFDMAAADAIPVAATHAGFPGLGRIARDGSAYRWAPLEFSDVL